jgi:hypothetical protein
VTDEQLKYSLKSEDAKGCKQISSDLMQLRHELEKARLSSTDSQNVHEIQSKLQRKLVKYAGFCQKYSEQLNILDNVSFHFEHNYPFPSNFWSRLGWLELKERLLPFKTSTEDLQIPANFDVTIQFKPEIHVFNMNLSSLENNVTYENIRIPIMFKDVLPWSASKAPFEQMFYKLTGMPSKASCWVGDGSIRMFSGKSYQYSVDDCYHILVGDCTTDLKYAVLLKEINGVKYIQVLSGKSKIIIKQGHEPDKYQITMDEEDIPVVDQEITFLMKDGETSSTIKRSAFKN